VVAERHGVEAERLEELQLRDAEIFVEEQVAVHENAAMDEAHAGIGRLLGRDPRPALATPARLGCATAEGTRLP
jgi:hypothetical protein